MSYAVNFYTFSKRDNSTKRPTGSGTSLQCEIRYESSILSPVLQINTVIANPSNLNYAYIPEFNRYYWINDWSYDRGFWIVRMSVDVLATYKDQIGSSELYVLRASSAYTPALPDGKYPMKNSVLTASASVGVNDFHSDVWNLDFRSGGCYILGVTGGHGNYPPNGGGVTYYALTPTELEWLLDFLFGGDFLTADDISVELQKEIFNPFQYIVSCHWIPVDIASSSNTIATEIYLGYWHDSGVIGNYIPVNLRNILFTASLTLPRHPQASRGIYLNGRPYTELELHCFTFGSIPIDPAPFSESPNMALSIDLDVFTGTGFLTVDSPTGKIVHRQAGQIGVPVQLSQITQNLVNTAISTMETVGSAFIGNWVGMVHGIVSASESLFPQVRTSGEVGSASAYRMIPQVTAIFHYVADDDPALLGKPLCSKMVINQLSGYVAVENGDIDSSATYNESNAVKSYLEGGFFYE